VKDARVAGTIDNDLAVMTQGVGKVFGRRRALAEADLRVPKGAAYVLVGQNGAGKTTLLRILLDLVRADAGTASVHGYDSVRDGAWARSLCGYLPERQDAGYGWMKVRDLLAFHASYRRTWDAAYASSLVRTLEVRDHARFGKLSKGEARRLQLVLALAHRPQVLLLDEPTDGLDPVMRDHALRLLAEHVAESETSLVVSTHLVSEVEGLGDHLGVLRDGVISTQLDRTTLRNTLRSYLMEVPKDWAGVPDLSDRVVSSNGLGREMIWTVWGDEPEVVARLAATGVTVREVRSLTLESAALSLPSEPGPRRVDPAATVTVSSSTDGRK
jgi:ABC-2 type transport system ATP-binding protein